MLNIKVVIIACFITIKVSCKEVPLDDRVLLKFYKTIGCREVQDFDSFRPKRCATWGSVQNSWCELLKNCDFYLCELLS